MTYLVIAAGAIGFGVCLYYWRSGMIRVSDDKSLTLFPHKLTMNADGGGRVRTLTFYGVNASAKNAQIRSAIITSAITETSLSVDIEARRAGGGRAASAASRLISVPPGAAGLSVPPGARIMLIAKFNWPLGLSPDDFITGWGSFSLVVEDEAHRYELAFTEKQLKVFFPGARNIQATTNIAASQ
ncbi:hypothetical protein [Methylocella silvestris]|uniref:hypothetical protein n=1 Tax=Methylocella silvestris TaxID=199596 RepID=UPI0011AF19D1|nr:hypothetical protein [Methylocella silvestris]